jgi:hypothetical protein
MWSHQAKNRATRCRASAPSGIVIGPWPLGPAANESGGYGAATIIRTTTHRRPSRLHPSLTLWTREATHLSIARRTGPYLSAWKVARLFNHIRTGTSRVTRCATGGRTVIQR